MEITITTDGTLTNTKLMQDGKDITKNNKIVDISLWANAPYKSAMTGDVFRGGINVSYSILDEKGTIERKSIGSSDTNYIKGIGQKIKQEDSVLQYIGQAGDAEIIKLADTIIKHCTEHKISCPVQEVLITRTKESLVDKIKDLEIKLEI